MKDPVFYDLVKNARKIKKQYKSYFHPKYNDDVAIRRLKRKIYSIEIIEWKKDALWSYLNNEMTYKEMLDYLQIKDL